MKKLLVMVTTAAVFAAAPLAAHEDRGSNIDAAIGGGLGGAVGAVLGNEIGGRQGAIIGAGVGGAGGAAISTRRDRHDDHYRGRHGYRDDYYGGHHYQSYGPRGGGFCPPGQAKKGRC